MLGMENNAASDVTRPTNASSPSELNDVTSGVGYAYNISSANISNMQPKFYHPWGGGCPVPGEMPPFGGEASMDGAQMAQMAAMGFPLPPGAAVGGAGMTAALESPRPGQYAAAQQSGGASQGGKPQSKREKPQEAAIDRQAVSPPPARERFSYTRYQIELLNGIIAHVRYPNSMQKQLVAKRVGITRDQVKIWFQNRRRKDVTGKTTSKDDDNKRTMVTDDILDGVIAELLAYNNDPKGRKLKTTTTAAAKSQAAKSRSRKQQTPHMASSPYESDESSQSRSPLPMTPPLESVVSEPYRPNCLSFSGQLPIHSPNSFGLPAGRHSGIPGHNFNDTANQQNEMFPGLGAGMVPSFGGGLITTNSATSAEKVSRLQLPHNESSNGSTDSGNSVNSSSAKSETSIFSVGLDSVPLPAAGQGTALPVSTTSESAALVKRDTETENEKAKVLTVLTTSDESSNDSNYSVLSSSNDHTTSSLTNTASSVTNKDNVPTHAVDITAPPNVVAPNCENQAVKRGLKRSRSTDSYSEDDEEEPPPKKRQESLSKAEADAVPPPNKVAPPSEPLKFDLAKLKVPTTAPLTVSIPEVANGQSSSGKAAQSSPILMAPGNPVNQPQWPNLAGRPADMCMPNPANFRLPGPGDMRVPVPVRPMPDGADLAQFNPYLQLNHLPPHYKHPGMPDIPWNPFYAMPPGSLGQPWESTGTDPSGVDASGKPSVEGAAMFSGFMPTDPFKMVPLGGLPEDGQKMPGPLPGAGQAPPWMLGAYPNHYTNFVGPPPVPVSADKPAR